jgi:hypothetical protein
MITKDFKIKRHNFMLWCIRFGAVHLSLWQPCTQNNFLAFKITSFFSFGADFMMNKLRRTDLRRLTFEASPLCGHIFWTSTRLVHSTKGSNSEESSVSLKKCCLFWFFLLVYDSDREAKTSRDLSLCPFCNSSQPTNLTSNKPRCVRIWLT